MTEHVPGDPPSIGEVPDFPEDCLWDGKPLENGIDFYTRAPGETPAVWGKARFLTKAERLNMETPNVPDDWDNNQWKEWLKSLCMFRKREIKKNMEDAQEGIEEPGGMLENDAAEDDEDSHVFSPITTGVRIEVARSIEDGVTEFYWAFYSANGRLVATGPRAYDRLNDLKTALKGIREDFAEAPLVRLY